MKRKIPAQKKFCADRRIKKDRHRLRRGQAGGPSQKDESAIARGRRGSIVNGGVCPSGPLLFLGETSSSEGRSEKMGEREVARIL